jgi:ribonuclease J
MTDNTINYNKKELLFLPLGGAKEIGMNFNLYSYNGKWLIIDVGAGFADDYYPGIDLLVPDIKFLEDKLDDILGIVLTHAHEDHLGAVQYLWQDLRCPIYTTKFTASVLKMKLAETEFANQVQINILEEGSRFDIGPFNIETVPITHSTPEMQALMIRTEAGNVFHTGDWKFDHNPLLAKPADISKLKALGDEGVLALVGDSTNVFNKESSGSEGDLRESIIKLVASCKNAVLITTFASNVARVETVLEAAKVTGRKVVIVGRSLFRIIQAAQESGYLNNYDDFVKDDNIKNIPREKLLILSTGCQGEPLAATTKIAFDTHHHIKLHKGDTVIFSSKIIPGNDKKIFRLFNQFVHTGIEVFTEKDHFVHVSGHPSSSELKEMYSYIRPQISVPVHGELVHMYEHARLAKTWGVKHAIQVENGTVLKLCKENPKLLGTVHTGYFGIDGQSLLAPNCKILKDRRRMQKEGIVFIFMVNDKNGKLMCKPAIKAPGLLDQKVDNYILSEISDEVASALSSNYKNLKSNQAVPSETIINTARSVARRMIKIETGKSPMIEIHIEKV